MIRRYILSLGIAVIALFGVFGIAHPQEAQAFWGPWQLTKPYLLLSSYEGAPGGNFTVSGHGFNQFETVTVSLMNTSQIVTADAKGSISTASLSVPFATAGNYKVTAVGSTSGKTASANFYISGYYPNINPASYYVARGSTLNVTGTNFAPNQTVYIYVNGVNVGTTNSSANGNVNFNVTTPVAGSTFTLKAQTILGISSTRTLTLR